MHLIAQREQDLRWTRLHIQARHLQLSVLEQRPQHSRVSQELGNRRGRDDECVVRYSSATANELRSAGEILRPELFHPSNDKPKNTKKNKTQLIPRRKRTDLVQQ